MKGELVRLDQFFALHASSKGDGLRLGQRFVNMYVPTAFPELFYERDDKAAARMITEWLAQEGHADGTLPPHG